MLTIEHFRLVWQLYQNITEMSGHANSNSNSNIQFVTGCYLVQSDVNAKHTYMSAHHMLGTVT